MGTDTTNQKKGIVTLGSGHIAESSGASLPYYRVLSVGTVMDDNHIETNKCSLAQAAQRTRIAGFNVLHHQSKIGIPFGGQASTYDRGHGYAQLNPSAYEYYAEPAAKSPDTKVEGKWIVRSFDLTQQDGNNGNGKFSPAPSRAELVDESDLLFQQCAVEKIKLESVYTDEAGTQTVRTTMGGELHVYIGQQVTVTAYRINATETDPAKRLDVHCHIDHYRTKKKPPAEETQHAAFVLTRNGRTILAEVMGSSWTEIKNKTLVGTNSQVAADGSSKATQISVLELKEDWLLAAETPSDAAVGPVGGDYESYDGRQDGNSVQHKHANAARDRERLEGQAKQTSEKSQQLRKDIKKAGGSKNSTTPELDAAEVERKQAKKDLKQFNRTEASNAAERENNAKAAALIASTARLALDSWAIVQEVWLYKPLRIKIEAHGCSPGANAVVLAYPSEKYGAELACLKDFVGRKRVETVKNLITTIRDFFQKLKGVNVREIGKTLGADPGLGASTGFNIDVYFFRHKASSTAGNSSSDEDMSPSIELELQWKLLTRDSKPGEKEAAGRKIWQAYVSWGVDVKLERLLGLTINFEIDMNYCLGIGKVITDILKFFGVKTGIFLNINVGLSVGIGGTIKRDEYGKWEPNILNVPLKSVLQLSLVVKVGRFLEVGFRVTGRWEPKFSLGKVDEQVCLKRTAASFDIVLTFEAKVDILGWDVDASYEIHKWPFHIDGSAIPLLGDGK